MTGKKAVKKAAKSKAKKITGTDIAAYRRDNGISRKDFGYSIGVPAETVAAWENLVGIPDFYQGLLKERVG